MEDSARRQRKMINSYTAGLLDSFRVFLKLNVTDALAPCGFAASKSREDVLRNVVYAIAFNNPFGDKAGGFGFEVEDIHQHPKPTTFVILLVFFC